LLLEPQQLGACLAELPVGVGQLANLSQLLRGWGDVLRPALAAIREDGAGVQFPAGTVAVGLSTAAAEGVQGTWQERFAGEEGFQKFLQLRGDGEQLGAERAEVVWHGELSGVNGSQL